MLECYGKSKYARKSKNARNLYEAKNSPKMIVI